MSDAVVTNPWSALRRYTPAHVGLGRAGVSLPTATQLAFALAHARARDAVHDPLDVPRVRAEIGALGLDTLALHSAAPDRATYLQRPDLGRRLDEASHRALDVLGLPYRADAYDVAFVVCDGLSSRAAQAHAAPMLREVLGALREGGGWQVAPVAVVEQARVAVGDVVGEALRVPLVVVLIGERPGLSAPDSLGAYLTWDPRPGRTDAERNCISNIRPQGQPPAEAARRLVALMIEARRRRLTGVSLKDREEAPRAASTLPGFLIGDPRSTG
ncbi:ethanolamine ammonia-lyase light chain [Luteitalea sp. TBR-22]|uniref:ethanolamine ammonia-lyase subunit EutC n=1 Tax=Luteitalea sp. TBR-22 TaxID=2802971 RepID=UPI001AFB5EDD|nr:ethanolamine ammonia-lyase subunit EutC [Luteitalea sp. TBR-22]BCS33308.1 ethanolamine ammonia-lyase light chain [Luteitalea sp. TBR-22]